MLFTVEGEQIETLPRTRIEFFDSCVQRLSGRQIEAMRAEINRRFDAGDVNTSSWIPGSDWTGTPFEPIYYDACHEDWDSSRWFFGLLVWDTVMQREDSWAFIRQDVAQGLTYFRVEF